MLKALVLTYALRKSVLVFFLIVCSAVNAKDLTSDKCLVDAIEKVVTQLINDDSNKKNPDYWNALGEIYKTADFSLAEKGRFLNYRNIYRSCVKDYSDQDRIIFHPDAELMEARFINAPLAYKMFTYGYNLGSPDSAAQLGDMNMRGVGTPRNLNAALEFSLVAARGGSLLGQHIAGLLYAGYDGTGRGAFLEWKNGLKPNYILAYMWFNIMAAKGDKTVENIRDEIQKRLDVKELQQAQDISTECFHSDYKKCPTEFPSNFK